MVTFGLAADLQYKVTNQQVPAISLQETDDGIKEQIFTSYALIGLKNFFASDPDTFINRLSKGPPAAYRWIVWKFMANQFNKNANKSKNKYEKLLEKRDKSLWLRDIEKDIDRSFPSHTYFKTEQKNAG